MRRRLAARALSGAVTLVAALGLLAGCRNDPQPPPTACFEREQVGAALRSAGDARTLADGTALSRCVELSTSDEFLQDLGLVLTRVADELAERALTGDAAAAERLGYLVGATARGAAHSQGIQLELARRIESSARRVEGERARRALVGGLRAGEDSG